MKILVSSSSQQMGRRAAAHAARELRAATQNGACTRLILATGASQFETLAALVAEPGIAWERVTVFHLDEYAGLSAEHPASFRRYLRERFVHRLPTPPAAFHEVDGEGDLEAECARLGALIAEAPIDLACIGIGENGHLAFNDPPANFQTETPFLVVQLDEACRQQQLGEGWFPDLNSVPQQAISMSIRQIMKTKTLVVSVPDERKALAVRNAVEGEISPKVPASILQTHPDTTLYLDEPAATLLSQTPSST